METEQVDSVVTELIRLVSKWYVFPDIGEEVCGVLAKNLKKRVYDAAASEAELAKLLVSDLRSVNGDIHLNIEVNSTLVEKMRTSSESERPQDYARRENYGFETAEFLSDKVAYLKLTEFINTQYAGDTAVEVMRSFVDCEYLIVDLRDNCGGSPTMVQLLTTYLFDYEPVHLNDFYVRETNRRDQFWTLPYVPGKRLDAATVYVLTSGDTFSAAEEFCYNLKNLKRATIVGEATGGGAHPGDEYVLSDELVVFVADSRAINPITETNWESIGVQPDVAVPADQALQTVMDLIASE